MYNTYINQGVSGGREMDEGMWYIGCPIFQLLKSTCYLI